MDRDRDLKISSPLFAKRISGRVGSGRTSRLSQQSSGWFDVLPCDIFSDCKLRLHILKFSGCSRISIKPLESLAFSTRSGTIYFTRRSEKLKILIFRYVSINACNSSRTMDSLLVDGVGDLHESRGKFRMVLLLSPITTTRLEVETSGPRGNTHVGDKEST